MTAIDSGAALPKQRRDFVPALLPIVLALAALPFVGSPSTWVTLTVAGLSMGMMIFIMASGLTLVFGLMDVLNFGHGAFISLGAYAGLLVAVPLASSLQADSMLINALALLATIVVAMLVTGAVGYAFERLIVAPVYGQHLKQILITMGGLIIAQQLIIVIWGPVQIALQLPAAFQGSLIFGEVAIERYRLIAVVIGLVVFGGMFVVLKKTKLGLLIRAGVENREMVEALGYRIKRL